MTLFFILFLILLLVAVQKWALRRCLESVYEDYWAEKTVTDPEEPFSIILAVRNQSRRYLPFVKVEMQVPEQFRLEEKAERVVRSYTLRPWQEVRFHILVRISRRGRYVLRHPVLLGGDFLGLKENTREFRQFREVIVAPAEVSFPALEQALGSFLGDYSVQRFLYEDPILTVGCREYTGREPMKMIAWKQSARLGTWMVHQYDHTVEPAVTVLLNMDTREEPERIEAAYSIARTVCATLEDRQIKYDFATNASQAGGSRNGASVSEGLGETHFRSVVECLGRGMEEAARPFCRLIEEAALQNGRNRGLLVITPGEGLEQSAENAAELDRWRRESGENVQVLCARTFFP